MKRKHLPRHALVVLAALVVAASVLVTALAQEGGEATDAPLGASFLDAFLGDTGVYDIGNAVVQPQETHIEVEVKAAHDGERIFFQYTFPTPQPSLFHGASVYRDGAWARLGQPPVRGPQADGLYEDKLTMLIDDGSVKGFASQGGWITCHEDVRGVFASAPGGDVAAHPVLGERGITSMPKYLPQSRDTGPAWWEFDGWDDITVAEADRIELRREHGVFLDVWLWGSHRTNPTGRADNESVFDVRRSDPGTGPFRANWNGQEQQPAFMFDPDLVGFNALDWDVLEAGGYGVDDPIYLIEGVNAIPFDPDHEWNEGAVIPAQILNPSPTASRGDVGAEGRLIELDDGDWAWQVTLWRDMETDHPHVDKVFRAGRTYNVAVAVHRLATGSRWHYVTSPFTVGIDTPGAVTAARFQGDAPNWEAIAGTTRIAVYPGQTTWQWLTSDDHPGGVQVRNDSMSVIGCHDEVGLGTANKAMETYLAGLTPFGVRELTVARPGFDPGNIVFWFVVLAILILAAAIGIGWLRRG